MDMRSNTMQRSVEKQKMREESQTFYIIKYYMFQKNLEKGGRDERDNIITVYNYDDDSVHNIRLAIYYTS